MADHEQTDDSPDISVTHIADEQSGDAGTLQRVVANLPKEGGKLRLRTALMVWDPINGQYLSWKGQSWRVDLAGPEHKDQAIALKEALEDFFDLVARYGAAGARDRLRQKFVL